MKKIRFGIVVLLFALAFSVIYIGRVITRAATVDITGPTVSSISIANHNYKPGDKVTFSIDVEDDVSGIGGIYLAYSGRTDLTRGFVQRASLISGNKWSITLPINAMAQTYRLAEIMAEDNAGNLKRYSNEVPTDVQYNYLSWDMDLNISAGSAETDPPVVTEVTINKTELKPGEKAIVTAKITDSSIIKSAAVVFREVGKIEASPIITEITYDANSGYYKGTITAPNVQKTFELDTVSSQDIYDNSSMYISTGVDTGACVPEAHQFCTLTPIILKINGTVADDAAPSISKVYFDKAKVSAPSTIKAYIKASDDVSGLYQTATMFVSKLSSEGGIIFNSEISHYGANMSLNSATGLYEGVFDISQYNEAGAYAVSSITMKDNAGNEKTYNFKDLPNSPISFQIIKSLNVDLTTGVSVKDVVAKIKAAADYSTIMIDSTSSAKITKDIFDAIKDTNKSIYIETQGIQWVLNGKDIVNSKDIDVSTTIQMISQEDKYNISDILDKAIVITFAENGELPGKTLIRVKADYAFRNYIGIEGLKVYYYDEDSKNFVEVDLANALTDDGFYEFYISHNSTYVITNKAPAAKYISKTNFADLSLNDKATATEKIAAQKVVEANNMRSYLVYGGLGLVMVAILTIVIIKKKKSKGGKVVETVSEASDIPVDSNPGVSPEDVIGDDVDQDKSEASDNENSGEI